MTDDLPLGLSPALLFHTVRHLRPRQAAAQVTHRIQKVIERPQVFSNRSVPKAPRCRWSPRGPFLPPGPQELTEADLIDGRFRFLQQTHELGWPPAWRISEATRLWQYNLHYFEYLWALSYEPARALVGHWIDGHRLARDAIGWEPYPISLRLLNWCGFFFGRHADAVTDDDGFREVLWKSIFVQSEWLLRHRETHILGNHLLENAIGLTFAGSCFEGEAAKRWKKVGLELLSDQLREQVRDDGSHFEQSPMYQLRIIYALLALINSGDADLTEHVREPLERMLKASVRMIHPDGEIALLGDSAFSIYNEPAELWNWWNQIERGSPLESPADIGSFALPNAGYYGSNHPSGDYLICDAGPIGPPYQPGHAHGDLFSFELSLRGHRVICDAGVFGYGVDALRRYCRSTQAHNTIEIEGADQCEFWSAFRVGRRARPHDVHWEPRPDGFRLSGWHDGYERLAGKPRHHRQFRWHQRGALQVVDSVTSAKPVRVASRLHLHPACEISTLDEQAVQVQTPGGAVYVAFAGRGKLEVQASIYCPQFGVQRENHALVFSTEGVDLRLGYSISRESLDDALTLAVAEHEEAESGQRN